MKKTSARAGGSKRGDRVGGDVMDEDNMMMAMLLLLLLLHGYLLSCWGFSICSGAMKRGHGDSKWNHATGFHHNINDAVALRRDLDQAVMEAHVSNFRIWKMKSGRIGV